MSFRTCLRVRFLQFTVTVLLLCTTGCASTGSDSASATIPASPSREASGTTKSAEEEVTVADAIAFVDSAEAVLYELEVQDARANWIQATYITHDTNLLASEAYERFMVAAVELATGAARFMPLLNEVPYDVTRKLDLLRSGITLPAPQRREAARELSKIVTEMTSTYSTGTFCPDGNECLDLQELSKIIATSRDPDSLLLAWSGWRTVSPPMRDDYERFVELTYEGARALGFDDAGAMWRSSYDMSPEEFAKRMDELWTQVEPLYEALHCHVRARLSAHYGENVVPPEEPIPAHVLGNMWAQQWGNIFSLVAPDDVDVGYDLTEQLKQAGYDERQMVKVAERFFTSMGLQELPETFWERSLFVKPSDRNVICHPSAWNLDDLDDVRIKMCININDDDFQIIHHELGHNYYELAYKDQPYMYRGSANDAFHEALGDAVALSVTPDYLQAIGLIEYVPPPSKDIGLLLRDALDKVAFLPFGLLVDKWRWQVFSGEIGPEAYNTAWWHLRETYQGIQPPVERSESDFDPGAKYHVPAATPYARYFLAHILQFQLQRALCAATGYEGPLHRCSLYGNEEAGRRLFDMMALGRSRPWPEALKAVTGEPEMDASAILDYFAPLKEWLDVQNEGRACGW